MASEFVCFLVTIGMALTSNNGRQVCMSVLRQVTCPSYIQDLDGVAY